MSYVDGGTWLWNHTADLKILDLVRRDLCGEPYRLLVAQCGNVDIFVAAIVAVQVADPLRTPKMDQRFPLLLRSIMSRTERLRTKLDFL